MVAAGRRNNDDGEGTDRSTVVMPRMQAELIWDSIAPLAQKYGIRNVTEAAMHLYPACADAGKPATLGDANRRFLQILVYHCHLPIPHPGNAVGIR